jgi:hypothetical protein
MEDEKLQEETLRERVTRQVDELRRTEPGSTANQTWSVKLSLLQDIDDEVDELIKKMSALRELRRTLQREPDHVAALIRKAFELSKAAHG